MELINIKTSFYGKQIPLTCLTFLTTALSPSSVTAGVHTGENPTHVIYTVHEATLHEGSSHSVLVDLWWGNEASAAGKDASTACCEDLTVMGI